MISALNGVKVRYANNAAGRAMKARDDARRARRQQRRAANLAGS